MFLLAQVSDTEAKLAAEAASGESARGEAASLQKELTGMKAALDGTAADLTAERAASERSVPLASTGFSPCLQLAHLQLPAVCHSLAG